MDRVRVGREGGSGKRIGLSKRRKGVRRPAQADQHCRDVDCWFKDHYELKKNKKIMPREASGRPEQ
jgi:hypothetical protein